MEDESLSSLNKKGLGLDQIMLKMKFIHVIYVRLWQKCEDPNTRNSGDGQDWEQKVSFNIQLKIKKVI